MMNFYKVLLSFLIIFSFVGRIQGQINVKESYELINQIINTEHLTLIDIHAYCPGGLIENDSVVFKPEDYMLTDKELIKKGFPVIDSLIKPSDLQYMKKQIEGCKRNQYWEKDSLPDFVRLFKLKGFIPLLPKKWNIKRNKPPSLLRDLSYPVFNMDMTVALIERGWYYGYGSGGSDLYIYVKRNDKWIEYAIRPLWLM